MELNTISVTKLEAADYTGVVHSVDVRKLLSDGYPMLMLMGLHPLYSGTLTRDGDGVGWDVIRSACLSNYALIAKW